MDLLAFFIPGLFAVEENLSPKEALYAAIILAVFFIWFLIACKPWQKTPEEKQKKEKTERTGHGGQSGLPKIATRTKILSAPIVAMCRLHISELGGAVEISIKNATEKVTAW